MSSALKISLINSYSHFRYFYYEKKVYKQWSTLQTEQSPLTLIYTYKKDHDIQG